MKLVRGLVLSINQTAAWGPLFSKYDSLSDARVVDQKLGGNLSSGML